MEPLLGPSGHLKNYTNLTQILPPKKQALSPTMVEQDTLISKLVVYFHETKI